MRPYWIRAVLDRMRPRTGRLWLVLGGLLGLGAAVGFFLTTLKDNIVFFRAPSEIYATPPVPMTRFRIGGMVRAHSLTRAGLEVRFIITDFNADVMVRYEGILPDLFREEQGVVAEGYLNGAGIFIADTVFAKHDENYMPPEAAEALKGRVR